MKKLLLFAAAMAVCTACQESLEEKADREAREYTEKNCPLRMSESVVLDSFTFDKGTHTFGYHYRLLGELDSEKTITPSQQQKTLVDGVRNTTALQPYREADFNFRYIYRSERDHDVIYFDTTIKPEDYK